MRPYLLLACCVVLMICGIRASAQRCGDHLWFYVRDSDGKIISPESFNSIRFTVNDEPERVLDVKNERLLLEVPAGIKSIAVATGCGYRLMKFSLSYHAREMVLILHNVPGDYGNILLESVPFQEGSFEIDLKNHERKNCEKDLSIKEPQDRRSDQLCVIRPTAWARSKAK